MNVSLGVLKLYCSFSEFEAPFRDFPILDFAKWRKWSMAMFPRRPSNPKLTRQLFFVFFGYYWPAVRSNRFKRDSNKNLCRLRTQVITVGTTCPKNKASHGKKLEKQRKGVKKKRSQMRLIIVLLNGKDFGVPLEFWVINLSIIMAKSIWEWKCIEGKRTGGVVLICFLSTSPLKCQLEWTEMNH